MTPEDFKEIGETKETLLYYFGATSFLMILKLIMPVSETRSISIKIPETIVFNDGIGMSYFSSKDGDLMSFNPTGGFSNLDMRKLLVDQDNPRPNEDETEGMLTLNQEPEGKEGEEQNNSSKQKFARPFSLLYLSTSSQLLILEKYPIIHCYLQFVGLIELRKADKTWKLVEMIQKAVCFSDNTFEVIKLKFDIQTVPKKLISMSSVETLLNINRLPKVSNEYVPREEEQLFAAELLKENPQEYCLYLLCKIYSYIKIVHRTEIHSMIGIFYNSGSDYFFMDAQIIRIEFNSKDTVSRLQLKSSKPHKMFNFAGGIEIKHKLFEERDFEKEKEIRDVRTRIKKDLRARLKNEFGMFDFKNITALQLDRNERSPNQRRDALGSRRSLVSRSKISEAPTQSHGFHSTSMVSTSLDRRVKSSNKIKPKLAKVENIGILLGKKINSRDPALRRAKYLMQNYKEQHEKELCRGKHRYFSDAGYLGSLSIQENTVKDNGIQSKGFWRVRQSRLRDDVSPNTRKKEKSNLLTTSKTFKPTTTSKLSNILYTKL